MSLAPEIVEMAARIVPAQATIVPERREEITTEGGIDLSREPQRVAEAVSTLKNLGVVVSAFIDPVIKQIALAGELGFDAVELHTGEYANAGDEMAVAEQLHRLEQGGQWVREHGMRLHAGHGLNYRNVIPVAQIQLMAELNIGHAIVSRALFTGLRAAVREMKDLLDRSTQARNVRAVESISTPILDYRRR
jgi:pyridoxine 5-phosphate synthase